MLGCVVCVVGVALLVGGAMNGINVLADIGITLLCGGLVITVLEAMRDAG